VDRIGFPLLFALSVLQVGCAAMLVPHTPEPFQNPIVECILPLFREGYLARNLGQLLGLPGVLSLLPWLGGSVLLAWLAVPRGDDTPLPTSRGLSLACGVVALGVSAGLVFVRTPPDVDLHIYRSRLLGNAGFALSSNDLVEAALREYQLSPTLNPPRRR
jgi:hypothetical protein